MSSATAAQTETIVTGERSAQGLRVARVLGTIVFVTLLCLLVLTAIPYGTSQPWWIASFVAIAFVLAILWLIEGAISDSWFAGSLPLVIPATALAVFSFLQTLPVDRHSESSGALTIAPWSAISSDPYQTRFFALLLLALVLSGVMLTRYATSERRMRIVINLVILVAVASSVFGILRQTMQHGPGFGLPLLVLDGGFGQFINRNHFAYLMEMGFGLVVGLILGGGVKREQALTYLVALLPIWIGLVLCNSRGGLIAMLAQIVIAALLSTAVLRRRQSRESQAKAFRVLQSLPVRIVLTLLLVAGVVFGTVWLGGDRLATRIDDRSELNADPAGLRHGTSRNEIWRASWHLFKAHPMLGVGMGGYWAAIPAFHDASGTMTPQEAHNDYLELLASGGVVGFALALWFGVAVIKRTRENLAAPNRFRRAACFGAAIGIAGVAVHSLVDFGLHTIVNALVFTTLIVIATSRPHWGNEPAKLHD